jgi:L-iditol 2-dehydrogenase
MAALPKTMKAAMLRGLRDVALVETEVPRPGPGEVLVRVAAALTCGTDRKLYLRGHPLFEPPFVFGHEYAGEIAAVGPGVEGWSPGTRVVAANSAPCNRCAFCKMDSPSLCDDLALHLSGAFAEYARVPAPIVAQNLLPVPDRVPDRRAAFVEPLACVVHGTERSGIRLGDTVAVLGTGPIGLLFVRLAHLKGARVIAVDRRAARLEVARQLGAHETLDVTGCDDPAAAVRARTENGRGVDVAIEAAGLPEVWETAVAAVRKGGTANLFGGCAGGTAIRVDTARIHYDEVTVKGVFHHTPGCVKRAMDLLAAGAVDTDLLVTHEVPLGRIEEAVDLLVRQEGIKIAVVP